MMQRAGTYIGTALDFNGEVPLQNFGGVISRRGHVPSLFSSVTPDKCHSSI